MTFDRLLSDVEEINDRMLQAADEGDWELFLSIAELRVRRLEPLQEKLIAISAEIGEVNVEQSARVAMIIENNTALEEIVELRLAVLRGAINRLQVGGRMDSFYAAVGQEAE